MTDRLNIPARLRRGEAVPVTGVWVQRDFPRLGGELRVMLEIDDEWHLVQRHPGFVVVRGVDEPGHVSHITEVAGIRLAPVYDFEEFRS